MKKVLFQGLLGLLFTTVTINFISAQTTAKLQPDRFHVKSGIKIKLNAPEPDPVANALPLNAVSSKAIRTFHSSFKGATNQQWYSEDNKFLTIFTSKDGRISRALIDKTGYLYYGINYGTEQSLSKEQRGLIRSRYVDYAINHVCEIRAEGQRVWIILLEDDNKIVKTRLTEDGSMDELEQYHKQLSIKKARKVKQ